jgi:hypothetical protein
MGSTLTLSISVILISGTCTQALRAQSDNEYSKLNTNLGMGMTVPLNPVAQLVGSSVDVVIGAGYNFNKHHALVGQFMWAGLPVNKDALRPIFIIANRQDISGSSNLFAITANYRYTREGRTFGVYWIGGGGLYYRRASLSQEVAVGTGTVCGPTYTYWGYGCVDGIVSQDQTLIKAGSSAFGGNGGMGFTIRINDEGYKFYVESRYHYAPTKNISTELMTITLGFSW